MSTSEIPVAIRPLHVEIDGISKYRQAYTADDLAGFLLSEQWPASGKQQPGFHRAVATSLDVMELYLDPDVARAAFVEAAHEAGMHVLPDDMNAMKIASCAGR
jgi:hypothetical protein